MIARLLAWVRRQLRPRRRQTAKYPLLPSSEFAGVHDDEEYRYRTLAAYYAYCILVSTGMATGGHIKDSVEAWELGGRLRDLYVDHHDRRGVGT